MVMLRIEMLYCISTQERVRLSSKLKLLELGALLLFPLLSHGGSLHKDEKRDRVIRVRQWTYEKLGELGSSKNDFDDVIFTLIEFWEKHHRRK